jgi:RNA polymerase sigma factor (sigma-70 family)
LLSPSEFAALVAAITERRDRKAFASLFDYFVPRLQAYLLRQGADSALAEEIAQDTMVVLWRKSALFDPAKSSLSTWLYRIARNRRIDLLRRDRTTLVEPDDPVFDLVD